MWGEQEPSGCPRSTGFSPIQPWFHVMQCKCVLDPGALVHQGSSPDLGRAVYTHVSRNETAGKARNKVSFGDSEY